jgi:hypothetical protein
MISNGLVRSTHSKCKSSCETEVGKPVNVTNGNMYLQQTDYRLPGVGEGMPRQVSCTSGSKNLTSGNHGADPRMRNVCAGNWVT